MGNNLEQRRKVGQGVCLKEWMTWDLVRMSDSQDQVMLEEIDCLGQKPDCSGK